MKRNTSVAVIVFLTFALLCVYYTRDSSPVAVAAEGNSPLSGRNDNLMNDEGSLKSSSSFLQVQSVDYSYSEIFSGPHSDVQGSLHTLQCGAADSPLIVFLHGAKFSSATWNDPPMETLSLLCGEGYRYLPFSLSFSFFCSVPSILFSLNPD